MKLEIISSPLYNLENGEPAYKSGEWEGIKPNHFGRTRLLLKQIRDNDKPNSIIFKKRYIHKSSSEYVFKPSKKQVKSYLENIEKMRNLRTGRKKIDLNNFNNIHKLYKISNINPKRRRPKDNFTSNSIILPIIKKDDNSNQKIMSFSSSTEINIENMMNKKKRIYSLEQQRNYYKKINPGDKNYRYAEHSPDFFKEGGLIVGSTNKIRITDNFNKLRNNIYQTMDLNIKSLDANKLWKSKVKKEKEKSEEEYVSKLEQWEKKYIKENNTANNNKNGKKKEKLNNNTQNKNMKKQRKK